MNKVDVADIYRLSPIQQGILFHSLYSPETAVYFDQYVWLWTTPIDIPAFVGAWQCMVNHHPILRTSFFWEDLDEPLQVVHQQVDLPFEFLDWRDVPADEQEARFETFLAHDRQRGVDFSEPPLMRLALIQTHDNSFRFVWSYHHILLDGWSISLLLNQTLKLYAALHNGQPPRLKRARPYRDYITWLRSQGLEQAETFWRELLRGFTATTPLGIDATVPDRANASTEAAERRLVFSEETTTRLQQIGRQQRITLSTLVQGAWALLLSRYSGQNDVVYGMTVSGRSPKLAGSESMIGVFINTLPVRVRVTPDLPLIVWLEWLQQQLIELAQYEYTPLIDIQQWSEVPRGQPVFESIVVFENFPTESAERDDSLRQLRRTNYALTIVGEVRPNLVVDIAYDRRRFDATLIERMAEHLHMIVEAMIAEPRQLLGQISMLTPDEQRQLVDWNSTAAAYALDQCAHELVEAQAAQTPDAIALIFADQALTYAELNHRANQLAQYLCRLGVGLEMPVGLCVERSPELLIGLLAIWKAGGAYVPLDPAYPQERLGFMLEDVQLSVLLTTGQLREHLPQTEALIICLDADWPSIAEHLSDNLPSGVQPDNLSYIMYTSGSTGRPKGVQNSHRGITNRLRWSQERYPLSQTDRVLQIASFSFDIALWELIGPLLAGAQVVMARPGGQQESGYLVRLMAEQQVTVAHFVPSLLQVVLVEPGLDTCDRLRLVFCGGEALPRDLPARFFARLQADLVQFYGPTEASINATSWDFDRSRPQAGVPIGRPIANTQVYLLDHNLHPVPIGVAGEIYIGGVGVARGYLNRPDQTAERFVPDPFTCTEGTRSGSRLYRTGDLARYLPDGVIQFLGRSDHQVKIRGFRVEPGEIEAVLRQHPGIQEAVVVARQAAADTQLVAYVVENKEQTNKEQGNHDNRTDSCSLFAQRTPVLCSTFLRERLPDYMVPSAFVVLDALPLTPTGKIDRQALPMPKRSRDETEAAFATPTTPTEQMLAVIWSNILGVEQVGLFDQFFELGGHSLKATQVITRIRDAFQVELPLRTLFEAPTVAALAARIDAARSALLDANVPPMVALPRDTYLPLSFAQQRLWFLDQLVPGNPFYNMLSAVQLTGQLDEAALQQSLNQVLRRHEALRTTFEATDGQPVQVIAPELMIPLAVVDCTLLPEAERAEQVRQLAVAEAQKPFDLAHGPLLRASLLRLSDTHHVLLLSMHHIVSDGWSIGILIDELARFYRAFVGADHDRATIANLPVQYADFAVWQRAWLAPGAPGAVLERQLAYWKQHLGGDLPVLDLPTDHPRPLVQSFRGATERFLFPKALRDGLVALSQREGATLFMTLLAAWQTLLFRYSGQDDILTSSPIANRTRREIEGLIGFFVNTLVLRTDLSGNPTFPELLRRVREAALGAYAHQDLPFEYLVEQLHPQRDLSRQPIFQVAFVLQNAPLPPLRLEDLTLSVLDIDSGTAKFDLTLYMWERLDGLGGALEYATDLFDQTTISRMIGHLQMLLDQIVADPARPIGQLPLLAPPEHEQLRALWSTAQSKLPPTTIQGLIEAQVARAPAATAVVFAGTREQVQVLSYADLNQRANHLAHYLQALGVVPDTPVGLCVERSPDLVVGVLGILKAGGAYVPIDPSYPRERIQLMLEDAQVPVLLTHERLKQQLPQTQARIVCLDAGWSEIAGQPPTNPGSSATADQLVYVIYTSGSTGRPKGTLITQRGLCNLVLAQIAAFEITPASRVLQFASLSFDASASEIFTALVAGASLHLVEREVILSAPDLMRFLRDHKITTMTLPPSLLALLPADDLPDLAVVVSAGETCSTQLAVRWSMPTDGRTRRFINAYGPTETTIGPTYYAVTHALAERADVPIGRPIPNSRAYVLDAYGQPTPVGVPGELWIGGVGVARGYLNQPALTAKKFQPDPFADGHPQGVGARMYRTGDRARFLADGNLEFLGRVDEQVKVRGFRIELNEIEAVLSQHPAVREAVVTPHTLPAAGTRPEGHPAQRLVAYVAHDPAYHDAQDDSPSEWDSEQITQWQQLFDETYREVGPDYDPTFNVSGWNSSYTGQPIPEQQMRVWVEQTVARIKALQPSRVLEIGCGTGLLLFRIAPECQTYVGSDFSRAALHSVQQQLGPRNLSHVTLRERAANDFTEIQPGSFDTVILNSVVQYFPSAEYLMQVLAGAVRAVAPGGQIFIGDVRSLPLLEAFHASVHFYQAPSSLSSAQLQQQVQTRVLHEEELAIDPAFFTALKQQLPQIGLVDVRLKRGRNDNELTRFRYDVVLHVGSSAAHYEPPQSLDWQQAELSVAAVRQLLVEQAPDALAIRRVPNARVQADVNLTKRLSAADGSEMIGDLRRGACSGGVDPEDLWALSAELPYAVGIGWSGSSADDCFDVTFRRRCDNDSATETIAAAYLDPAQLKSTQNYINKPLQGRFVRRLVPQLRRFLEPRLPEYMLPSAFVVLPALPRTPNGKVNRRMLPEPEGMRPALDVGYIGPRTEVERAVAAVWADVLQVERVGMDDNFFDLGGHSLLLVQLHSKLMQALGRDISVIDLFKYPTISALSEYLRLDTAEPIVEEPIARHSENRREEMKRQQDLRRRHRASKQQVGDEDDD